jgi:hypothetical protein
VILEELTAATVGRRQREDFSDIAGGWIEDPGLNQIVASQRQVDWEKWK